MSLKELHAPGRGFLSGGRLTICAFVAVHSSGSGITRQGTARSDVDRLADEHRVGNGLQLASPFCAMVLCLWLLAAGCVPADISRFKCYAILTPNLRISALQKAVHMDGAGSVT
jgi:hypothetical protein